MPKQTSGACNRALSINPKTNHSLTLKLAAENTLFSNNSNPIKPLNDLNQKASTLMLLDCNPAQSLKLTNMFVARQDSAVKQEKTMRTLEPINLVNHLLVARPSRRRL